MRLSALCLYALLVCVLVSCNNDSTSPSNEKPKDSRIFYTALQPDGKNGTIYSIKPDGRDKRSIHENMVMYSAPAAGRIAAMWTNSNQPDIVLLDTDGNELFVIPVVEGGRSPILSPAGDKILYSVYRVGSGNNNNGDELHIINTDGTNDIVLEAITALETFPVFSPDGKKVAFMKHGWLGTSRWFDSLLVINTDGTGRQVLTGNTRARFDKTDCASWSPDGSQLVSIMETGDRVFNLFTAKVDGSEVRQITSDTVFNFLPVWSPDGKRIVYSSIQGIGSTFSKASLLLINPDGTETTERRVSTTEIMSFPRWSPDGATILAIGLSDVDLPIGDLKVIGIATDGATTLDNKVFRGYWYTE